jgi:hypothetical protein
LLVFRQTTVGNPSPHYTTLSYDVKYCRCRTQDLCKHCIYSITNLVLSPLFHLLLKYLGLGQRPEISGPGISLNINTTTGQLDFTSCFLTMSTIFVSHSIFQLRHSLLIYLFLIYINYTVSSYIRSYSSLMTQSIISQYCFRFPRSAWTYGYFVVVVVIIRR